MTARAFGEIPFDFAGGKATKTTDQPVWRGSFDVDDPRAKVARPFGDGTTDGAKTHIRTLVRVAKEWAEHSKAPGKPHRLSRNAIKLLEVMLWKCSDWTTGKCEVTLEMIMEATQFARPTVVRLLALLRSLGFLDWARRTIRIENAGASGPQVRQTANAYFFEVSRLPVEAYRRFKQLMRGAKFSEHPERQGSGPVPSRAMRMLNKLGKGLARRWNGASVSTQRQRRALSDALAAAPASQHAAILYPDDPESQRLHNQMLGLSASSEVSPESPP